MPSVQSRPLIESDGNNLALRRILRLIKRMILKGRDLIIEGGLIAEEFLDTLGLLVVQLVALIGYPLSYIMPGMSILEVFSDKSLPQTLPLIFVLHIILLVYSTYVLCYLPAVGLGFDSAESIVFHLITALAMISYYRGVTTDPGGIPEGPEWEKGNVSAKQAGLRFCQREKKYKPDRTHYCSAIGRNVLKMDHYCPWLANCVGFANQKFFLLFITYASIACGWTTISVARILAASSGGFFGLSAAQIFFLTEGLCISSLISLILTPFTAFHWWLVSQNKTTLEYCEKAHSLTSYDKGVFGNFFAVFGYNPILWFFPIHSTPGTGLEFERSVPATSVEDGSSDEDEVEARIRQEFVNNLEEHKEGASSSTTTSSRRCCVRRWDSPDSPLLGDSAGSSVSNFIWSKCYEINEFREKLLMGFTNIMTKERIDVGTETMV
jgi:palmitoyltransferase ZDHHC2/15/20